MMCPSCRDRQWGPCTCPLASPTNQETVDPVASVLRGLEAFDFALWELELKGKR